MNEIRKEAMIENFGPHLGTDPKTIPSWGILTNLSSHSISMMRELIGSPVSVGYANRSGGVGSEGGEGVGWWNVIFDYEGFKAHYEVCPFFLIVLLFASTSSPSSHALSSSRSSPHPSLSSDEAESFLTVLVRAQ
jgi:predicted dehydrogenase